MLMSGMYLLVHTGLRYWRLGQAYQQAEQQAQIGIRKVTGELANSSRGAFQQAGVKARATAPTSFVLFPSAQARLPASSGHFAYSPALELQYQKWVAFYFRAADSTLVRCEKDPNPVGAFVAPADWNTLYPDFTADMEPLTGFPDVQVVARDIEAFSVVDGPPQTLLVSVTARSQTGSTTAGARFTRIGFQSQVRLENP